MKPETEFTPAAGPAPLTIEFATIDPRDAELYSKLVRKQPRTHINLNATEVDIAWTEPTPGTTPDGGYCIFFKFCSVPGNLILTGDLPEMLLQAAGIEEAEIAWDGFGSMDLGLAAMIAEHLMTPGIEALEANLDGELEFLALVSLEELECAGYGDTTLEALMRDMPEIEPDDMFRFRCTASDDGGTGYAIINHPQADRLLELTSEPADPFPTLGALVPLKARLVSAGASMHRSDLVGLCLDEVVLFPQEWSETEALYLVLADHSYAAVERSENELKVLSEWSKISEHGTNIVGEPIMSDSPETDDMSVVLTISFAQKVVKVAEVSDLTAGSVIAFEGTSAKGDVTLLANGKPIAQGRLVKVDGQTGVQITKME